VAVFEQLKSAHSFLLESFRYNKPGAANAYQKRIHTAL
jgi:hypothetical protein